MKAMILAALILASTVHAQEAPKRSALGTPNGRFVLGQIGESEYSQYLVDTQAGRVWSLVPVYNDRNQIIYWVLKQVNFVTQSGTVWGPEPQPLQSK